MADHNQQFLIELDANKPANILIKVGFLLSFHWIFSLKTFRLRFTFFMVLIIWLVFGLNDWISLSPYPNVEFLRLEIMVLLQVCSNKTKAIQFNVLK